MKNGFMIVIDGGNGAGKTTVIEKVISYLEGKGFETVFTREPGGTPISETIRDLLLSPDNKAMTDTTEMLLFAASRAQHIQQLILPSLNAGKVVVSDRFDSATFAFQHYAREIDFDLVKSANDIALGGFSPDITIILDLDVKLGIERIHSRGDGFDRMEAQDIEFLEKARAGYLTQAEESPDKFRVVDASQSPQKVADDVLSFLDKLLLESEVPIDIKSMKCVHESEVKVTTL